ncbi:MAG: Sb-PDE family phosphodiesterase [bacterium]
MMGLKLRDYTFVKMLVIIFLLSSLLNAQLLHRKEIKLPHIPNYETLKCDFHVHTVFSDGEVWPSTRVEEAWCQGLDVIALTDHIEYNIHKDDLVRDLNRPFEIASKKANDLGIVLINGAELTRDMPPGHLNALFLTDVNKLIFEGDDWHPEFDEAVKQNAFIFWNHPGWIRQAPDGIEKWYNEHTSLYEKGVLQGIEVVNGYEYYNLAHQWALDKNLTMFGNSDTHSPVNMEYDYSNGEHRTMTIVFAKEKTLESIREALEERRTVAYYKNILIGREECLRPLFDNSLIIEKGQIKNNSDIQFELKLINRPEGVRAPKDLILFADGITRPGLSTEKDKAVAENVTVKYEVTNLLIAPGKGLIVELPIK